MDRTFTIKSIRTELFDAFCAGWIYGNQDSDIEYKRGMIESDWESHLLNIQREVNENEGKQH